MTYAEEVPVQNILDKGKWSCLSGEKEEDHREDSVKDAVKEDIERVSVTEDARNRMRWRKMIHCSNS